MADIRLQDGTILTVSPDFKVGDPAPHGYLDWTQWAEVQHKGRLRQRECCRCCLWHYPQEQVFIDSTFEAIDARGRPVIVRQAVCLSCAAVDTLTTRAADATADDEGA